MIHLLGGYTEQDINRECDKIGALKFREGELTILDNIANIIVQSRQSPIDTLLSVSEYVRNTIDTITEFS